MSDHLHWEYSHLNTDIQTFSFILLQTAFFNILQALKTARKRKPKKCSTQDLRCSFIITILFRKITCISTIRVFNPKMFRKDSEG